MTVTPEISFCVKYLLDHGVNSKNFNDIAALIYPYRPQLELTKIKGRMSDSFFNELASGLRELWPPGEKDGKYPWRDSQKNIAIRLETLWEERGLKNYSVEQCLAVARKYLAQYENDTKYMKVLKYFIMKQDSIVRGDGRIKYVNKSIFADMLESQTDFDRIDEEWNDILNGEQMDQGELI